MACHSMVIPESFQCTSTHKAGAGTSTHVRLWNETVQGYIPERPIRVPSVLLFRVCVSLTHTPLYIPFHRVSFRFELWDCPTLGFTVHKGSVPTNPQHCQDP